MENNTYFRQSANPWRGLAPYDGSENPKSFCGRKEEQKRLRLMVENNACLTLYGASGVGKTSLLRAGVLPILTLYNYLPIYIRLSETNSCDVFAETIVNSLEKYAKKNENKTLIETKDFWFLWEYFCTTRFYDEKGNEVIPVLVLDQFEEVFRGSFRESAELLLMQIYTLINGSSFLPDGYHDDRNYRFVISMREDYLFALEDSIDRKGLSLLKNGRFRLRPLEDSQAREVVTVCPELLPDDLEERELVISTLINNSKIEKEVSTLLLSLLCYQAYESAPVEVIDMETVRAFGEKPLKSFCEQVLSRLNQNAVNFIIDKTVDDNGFRIPVKLSELKSHAVPEELWLDNNAKRFFSKTSRWVTKRDRDPIAKDDPYYELLHDQLALALLERKGEFEAQKELRENELLEVQSLYLAAEANNLVEQGNSYMACKLAIEALPKDLACPKRPYVAKAEYALRNAERQETRIIKGCGDYVFRMGHLSKDKHDELVSFWTKIGKDENSDEPSVGVTRWNLKTGKMVEKHTELRYFEYCIIKDIEKSRLGLASDYHGIDMEKSGLGLGFACHGTNIAFSNKFGNIFVWNPSKNKLEGEMGASKCHESDIYHLEYDGEYVLSGDKDGYLKLWLVNSGKCIFFNKEMCSVNRTVLGKNYFAAYYEEYKDNPIIKIWDKPSRQLVSEIILKREEVEWGKLPVVFMDDDVIAVGLSSGKIRLYNLLSCELVSEIEANSCPVTELFYDGKRLLSGFQNGDVKIWHFDNNYNVNSTIDLPKHHNGYIVYLCCIDDFIVSADHDVIKKWRSPIPPKPIYVKSNDINVVKTYKSGNKIMLVDEQGKSYAYDHKLSDFKRVKRVNEVSMGSNMGELIKQYDTLIIECKNYTDGDNKRYSKKCSINIFSKQLSSSNEKDLIETIYCNDGWVKDFEYDEELLVALFDNESIKVWEYPCLSKILEQVKVKILDWELTSEERVQYHCVSNSSD